MIRRVILFTIVIYISIWFLVAYFVKGSSVKIFDRINTDNVKFSYEKVNVYGFPFLWKIKFTSPKITSTDHNRLGEFGFDNIVLEHSFYVSRLTFGKEIYYNDIFSNIEHTFKSSADMSVTLSYNRPVFFYKRDAEQNFSSIRASVSNIEYFEEGKIVANIDNINFYIEKEERGTIDFYKTKFLFNLTPEAKNNGFHRVKMLVDLDYYTPTALAKLSKEKVAYNHKLNFNKFNLDYANSQVKINGVVMFEQGMAPKGKINFYTLNHDYLIDNMIPDNFVFSKPVIKEYLDYNLDIKSEKNISKFEFDLEDLF